MHVNERVSTIMTKIH
jgi:dynein heavy chain